ncbi:hypothetical protein TNIN_352441 [Trichonephila inaurata madagascariensis]|uniref:Uncharacterized protein n=1 Tax=Trichonephila inaurata madagascariensis TaxID=2747483 RepID=A0A8X6XVZ2_9ARAC|nr:hypothetical protein TNIN_352441 [Trichonephila inaurata madagascariensis]
MFHRCEVQTEEYLVSLQTILLTLEERAFVSLELGLSLARSLAFGVDFGHLYPRRGRNLPPHVFTLTRRNLLIYSGPFQQFYRSLHSRLAFVRRQKKKKELIALLIEICLSGWKLFCELLTISLIRRHSQKKS